MFDYSDIGLNANLRQINAPSVTGTRLPAMSFDSLYEVQTKRVISSQSAIENFWQFANFDTAVGTIGAGDWVTLDSTLVGNVPFRDKHTFGVPYVTAYEGTVPVGTMEIFPAQGAGISANQYNIRSGFEGRLVGSVDSVWGMTIINNAGTPAPVFLTIQWKYNIERAGKGNAT